MTVRSRHDGPSVFQNGRRRLRQRWVRLLSELETLRSNAGNGDKTLARQLTLFHLLADVERAMAKLDAPSKKRLPQKVPHR